MHTVLHVTHHDSHINMKPPEKIVCIDKKWQWFCEDDFIPILLKQTWRTRDCITHLNINNKLHYYIQTCIQLMELSCCFIILITCLLPGSRHHFHPSISGFHFWTAPTTEKHVPQITSTILQYDCHISYCIRDTVCHILLFKMRTGTCSSWSVIT
jgi:hypothetical protein